ncbi:hypothetical protein J3A83DRAFT_4373455 [Scleroderma citrinum]
MFNPNRYDINDTFPREPLCPEYYVSKQLYLFMGELQPRKRVLILRGDAKFHKLDDLEHELWSLLIFNVGYSTLVRRKLTNPTRYFPSPAKLPEGIPYFAGTNPNTWTDSTFDEVEAANGSGSQGDLPGSSSTSSTASSTSTTTNSNTSAIVGGIVGALAFIFLVTFLLCCIVRRRRRQVQAEHGISTRHNPLPITPILRTRPSQASMPVTQASPSPYSISGYAGSSHGMSATSLHLSSPTSMGHTVSPPISDAADMIVPFLASPTRTVHGSSKATDVRTERRAPPPPPQRSRMNPPPYSFAEPVNASSNQSTSPTALPQANLPHKRSTKHQLKHVVNGSVDSAHSGNSRRAATAEGDQALPPSPPPPAHQRQKQDPRPRGVRMLSGDESDGSTVTLSSVGHAGDSSRHRDGVVGRRGTGIVTPRKEQPAV